MGSVFHWSAKQKWRGIVLALVCIVTFSAGLPELEFYTSIGGLTADDSDRKYLSLLEANHGSQAEIILFAEGEAWFGPGGLQRLKDLTRQWETLPRVHSVDGIFSTPVRQQVGQYLIESPLVDTVPESEFEAEEVARALLTNPLAKEYWVAANGDGLAFYVDLEKGLSRSEELQVLSELSEAVRRARPGAEEAGGLYLLGPPMLAQEISEEIAGEVAMDAAGMLVTLCLFAVLFLRSFSSVFLIVFTSLCTVVSTLGLMGWIGLPVTSFSSILCSLIILIGSSEGIYLASAFLHGSRAGVSIPDLMISLGNTVGKALLLTVLSTSFAFSAIALNDIPELREFGLMSLFAIVFHFVLTLLFFPPLLARFHRPVKSLPLPKRSIPSAFAARIARFTSRRKTLITAAFALLAVLFGVGMLKLETSTDYTTYLPKDSEIRPGMEGFRNAFGGLSLFLVSVESSQPGTFDDPEARADLRRLESRLQEFSDSTFSVDRLYRHYATLPALSPDSPSPENVSLDLLPQRQLTRFIDHDRSRAVIYARAHAPCDLDALEFESRCASLRAGSAERDWNIRVSGERYLIALGSTKLAIELLMSLGILCLVTAAFVSVWFRSFRIFWIVLAANLFPIVAIYGVMGYGGIPLSVGLFPVGIFAFGISVDGTIHLLNRFSLNESLELEERIASTMRSEILPLSTVLLGFGIGILFLADSALLPIRQSSGLMLLAFVASYLAEIFLTPSLLRNPKQP